MTRTTIIAFALAALTFPVAAQTPLGSRSNDAANAAEAVAARATSAFERVDPDTQLSLDDDLDSEATAIYAGLPPLVDASAAEPSGEFAATPVAPRGPAVRFISSEVAQPLPAAPSGRAAAARVASTPAAITSTDPFVIKSILPIEGTIRYGEWFWDESAAPRTGKLVITVDLEARVISAFRDGHEIGTAVALLGTQKHPTPLGTFPILTKEKDNVSEKYNTAPMPHTLRLTWDGIAIHGSPVLNGYASHGCIGVPDEFAAKLFAAAKRGDRVIITRGRMVGIGDKVL